jgi:hypothetical protein
MDLSLAGLLVTAALLLLGRLYGASILIALLAAVPLQTTAFATLPALGGSSPPIAALLALLFVLSTLTRRQSTSDLRAVFAEQWTPWIIVGLAVYVCIGALLLPRIFLGQTSAFVVLRQAIFEVPLAPVPGNVVQSAYFVLNTALVVCLAMALRRTSVWLQAYRGMLALVAIHAIAGLAQLAGNLAGLADVLAPIRTTNYVVLADTQIGSLWRIAGATSEASAFSNLAIACLAFCVVYWRRTGSRTALLFGTLHLALLLLSTSSTAYVSIAVLFTGLSLMIAASVISGQPKRRDMQLLFAAAAGLVAILASALFIPAIVDAFTDVLDAMVFKKHLSASADERFYWNSQSIRAFFDTYGLGTGLGSSRASSWAIAVISQTGLLGGLAFAVLTLLAWRGPRSIPPAMRLPSGLPLADFAYAMRAAVMLSLVSLCISGTVVETGPLIYIGIAVCTSAPVLATRLANPHGPIGAGVGEPPHNPRQSPAPQRNPAGSRRQPRAGRSRFQGRGSVIDVPLP